MCNDNVRCGCNYENRGNEGCRRHEQYDNDMYGCGCNPFVEVERLARQAALRRNREDRCARQFCQCMRSFYNNGNCNCR